MKKIWIRSLALLLTVVALCSAFTGCSSNNPVVMEFDGVKITADIYRYWLSSFKDFFVKQYEDIEDTLESWNTKAGEEMTVGEYVEEYTLQYAKGVVCALKLFKDYKLKLSNAVTDKIDDNINDIIRYQYGDSKGKFNSALMETYGMDIDALREAFIIEAKVDMVEAYLFGENGKENPTPSQIDEFYKKNYMRIQVIEVYTEFEYVLDKEGNITYGSDGLPKKKTLTKEEQEKKKAKAEEAFKKASEGVDFDTVTKDYADIPYNKKYPNGFYLSKYDLDRLVKSGYETKILSEVFEQKTGTVKKYEASKGYCTYIVKKVDLKEKAYLDKKDKNQFALMEAYLKSDMYEAMLSKMWDDIVIDDYVHNLKTVDVKRGII